MKGIRWILRIRGGTAKCTTCPYAPASKNRGSPTEEPTGVLTPPRPLLADTNAAPNNFTHRAHLGHIDITALPSLRDPVSANDDLRLAALRPVRYIWGGGKRKGILMHIDDAESIDDHINQAATQDFLLPKKIPLLEEDYESIAFSTGTTPAKRRPFWGSQLKRVKNCACLTRGIQRIWDNTAHPEIRSVTGRTRYISISALLNNYDRGGSTWMSQCTYGFLLMDDLP